MQFLDPSLNFGQVRQVLRRFVGVAPRFPEAYRRAGDANTTLPVALRWPKRPRLHGGSPALIYLTATRCLPPAILAAADAADIVREGHRGSAWFAHRGTDSEVTHVEIRGPDFKRSLTGGTKTLFQLTGANQWPLRLALAKAAAGLSATAIGSPAYAWYDSWERWHPNHVYHPYHH